MEFSISPRVSVQKSKGFKMAKYVDGFVLAIPKNKIDAYKKLAKMASKVWLEHGALEYRECVAEDMNVKMGVPFPKIVNPKKNETIVFAWIVYKSRAHRDKVNAKVMRDERMNCGNPDDMPFDCTRMTYGGFEVLVDAKT